jgi:hypothetical protein
MRRVAAWGIITGVLLVGLGGLDAVAQLSVQAPSFTIDGGSPSRGSSFVAGVFLIQEPSGGQSGDTLKGIVISNSPASAPQAQGADVALVQLYIRDSSSPTCAVGDFDTTSGSNGLIAASWALASTLPGPLPSSFTSTSGVEIPYFLPFPDGTTRCFAIVITVASGATVGRKFRLQVAARKGDNSLTSMTTLNSFENVISEGPSVADQALGPGFSTVNAGAANQVLQILQITDSERGTNGSSNGRNLDPDSNGVWLTSVIVHNANAPVPKADSSDITSLKLFVILTSGGSSCPAPQSNGNPPSTALQIASLSGGALANFSTTGVTFSSLTIPISDEATGSSMVCLYIVADLLGSNGRNFKTNVKVSGTEGLSGTFSNIPSNGVEAGTTRTIQGSASAGCETFERSPGIGPSTILRGTVGFDAGNLNGRVMEFRCVDSDPDSNNVTINSVTINQTPGATAQPATDISRIAIYQCVAASCSSGDIVSTRRVGSATVSSFPVTINLSSAIVPDNSSATFAVVVDVASGATVGRTIQFTLTANVTEGSISLTHGPVVDDVRSDIIALICDTSRVRISQSVPSRIRFTQPFQRKTIRVIIHNQSGQAINIEDVRIREEYDNLVEIISTAPDIPFTINNGKRKTLRVTLEGPDEGLPVTLQGPYVEITFTCADSQTSGASGTLKALEVRGITAEVIGKSLRFSVQGHSVSRISVQLFDLMGRMVGQADAEGSVLVLNAQDRSNRPLAPGVYFYIVTLSGEDGSVWRSEVRKLVVK